MENFKQSLRYNKFSFGIVLTIAIDIFVVALFQVFALFFKTLLNYVDFVFLGFGLIQIVYMLPLILLLKRKRQVDLLKGVVYTVKTTAFLTSPCWIFLLFYFLLFR
jgi:hypothetical protein